LKAFGFLEIYPVASVFWTVAEIIGSHYQLAPPHIFAERRADAEKIFSSLGDEQSRTYFAGNLRWRVTLDPSTLPAGDRRHAYFDPRLFDLGDRPVIVDVGAFDGDSLRSFLLWHGSNFGKFFAIEPDPISFERLKAYLESLPDMVRSRITALPLAAADTAGMLQLAASGKPGSGGDNGAALIDVRCARLDNEFSDQMRIDYLKFDIEGAEAAALEGAWALIERHHPVVGIAAYHKPTDIIDIPLAFIERFPNWSYYFRAHDQDGIDFVFYAVSPSRQIMI
jgi:FkbM family methyltransferase